MMGDFRKVKVEERQPENEISEKANAQRLSQPYKLTIDEQEQILVQAGIIIFVWKAGQNWPVEYVSSNITQFGYTPEDFYQKRILFAQIIHPDDLERITAEVARYSEAAYSKFDQNYRIMTADGKVRWVKDHTLVRRDHNGVITHYQGIVSDVTESKQTEKALIESEMRYRQMFEAHPTIRWLVDPETQQLVDVNPAAAQFYGYSREKMRQMRVTDLNVLSPDEIKARMSLAQSKKRSYFEVPHRLASGEIRLVEIYAVPINIGPRQLLYAVIHDITERKKAEEALRQSNRQLALLNQAVADLNSTLELDRVLANILDEVRFLLGVVACSIWLIEPETNELVCRQATEPHSQVVRGWRLPPGEGVAGWVVSNGRSLNIANAVEDERYYNGVDKRTGMITRSLLCVPLSHQQRVIGVIEVMDTEAGRFNKTEMSLIESLAGTASAAIENARLHQQLVNHAAELEAHVAQRTQELVAANQQLKELDRLKTKLIEDISHELRTPVANLSLYFDLLERGKPEKREQYMGVLRIKMQQLIRLTEDVLHVFRLDLFKEGVVFQALDLNQIVAERVSACRFQVEEAGLQLVVALAQRPLPILAEKRQIEQVITNLLLNAINYTPAGSVQVGTAVNQSQNEVCLWVQDTGQGILPDDIPYIFDRFYRGHNVAQQNKPGTGLGLSVVQDVVILHNGRIEVDSEPERGSTFRIWLPLVAEN
ncbi:MAG: PAS domain S-box protein [Ardenticatenaceae bacterium]|nr:PAS domain S-box protein [Ardenticatenaceae bacterium]MCB9443684.1 PAS domain S-box protein [Ardenticatenaceae bacterium]